VVRLAEAGAVAEVVATIMEELALNDVVRVDGRKVAADTLVPVPLEDSLRKAVAAEIHRSTAACQDNLSRSAHHTLTK
jgi:hypothetical protein